MNKENTTLKLQTPSRWLWMTTRRWEKNGTAKSSSFGETEGTNRKPSSRG